VVTNSDGSQVLETVPALLEEVFPEGDILVDIDSSEHSFEETEVDWTSPEQDTAGELVGPMGLTEEFVSVSATSTSSSKVKVTYEYEGKSEAKCDLTGATIGLNPVIDGTFRVTWRRWKEPLVTALVTALVTVGADAGVTLDNVNASCSLNVPLAKIKATFMAGTVPVVVVIDLGGTLDFTAGLHGPQLEALAEARLVVGVRDNRAVTAGSLTFRSTGLDDAKLQARDLTLYAMADVWFRVSFKLYGVIGPKLALGPFLEMALKTNPAYPLWATEFGFAGRIALEIDLWFKSWDYKLFEGEIPLAQFVGLRACNDAPPVFDRGVFDGGVCRSSRPTGFTRPNGTRRLFADRFGLASSGEAFKALTIEQGAALTLPPGVRDEPYVGPPLTAGGAFATGIVWRVKPGQTAPPGLAVDPATGILTGTPTTSGTFVLRRPRRGPLQR
jgi:hypothetical protein